MATHRWHLQISNKAQKEFDKLPSESKKAVFSALQPLLEANNPLAVRGVCSVEGFIDPETKEPVWRVHADTHNLRLRVFFIVISGRVLVNEFEYNGKLIVGAIRKKDENTYSK